MSASGSIVACTCTPAPVLTLSGGRLVPSGNGGPQTERATPATTNRARKETPAGPLSSTPNRCPAPIGIRSGNDVMPSVAGSGLVMPDATAPLPATTRGVRVLVLAGPLAVRMAQAVTTPESGANRPSGAMSAAGIAVFT